MIKNIFILFIVFYWPASFANGPVVDCHLKVKAIEEARFWSGSYFDTAITSGNIEQLHLTSTIKNLKTSPHRKVELTFEDNSLVPFEEKEHLNRNDLKRFTVSYSLSSSPKTNRQVSSDDKFIPVTSTLKFQNFEKTIDLELRFKEPTYAIVEVEDKQTKSNIKVSSLF